MDDRDGPQTELPQLLNPLCPLCPTTALRTRWRPQYKLIATNQICFSLSISSTRIQLIMNIQQAARVARETAVAALQEASKARSAVGDQKYVVLLIKDEIPWIRVDIEDTKSCIETSKFLLEMKEREATCKLLTSRSFISRRNMFASQSLRV